MGDHRISVVEISLSASEVVSMVIEVTRWLLDRGIIEPNAERDDLWQPSEYRAGPQVLTVAPYFEQMRGVANTGVDVYAERELYHPTENYEAASCPVCATPLDSDVHHDFIEPWLAGTEPVARCERCGTSTLLGDWVDLGSFYVAELAVCFNNWNVLTDEFRTRLGNQLGPRWRVVYTAD